ncbi:MAG: 1-acyl-sn-glycerol-3-phosphate acyltransferase [Leptonema sp. (in: bacteria)]
MQSLSNLEIIKIYIQKLLGNIFFIIVGNLVLFYFKYIKKYKTRHGKDLRKMYKEITKKQPVLICPNHITYIDSAILQWILADNFFYLLNFSKFAWNIPAKENVRKSILFSIIAYLTKCILIERKGSREHKELVFKKLKYLLEKKEPICIFIQGTRSEILEEEQIHYGAGQLISEIPNTKVLVVYLRGKNQKEKSVFPKSKEEFFFNYKILEPKTDKKGVRAQKEITLLIFRELKKMEDEYFSKYQ